MVVWAGKYSKGSNPSKWFSSDLKEQTRVGKVAVKFPKLSSPEPHYSCLPGEMIRLLWLGNSKLALPSPSLHLPLNFEGKKLR